LEGGGTHNKKGGAACFERLRKIGNKKKGALCISKEKVITEGGVSGTFGRQKNLTFGSGKRQEHWGGGVRGPNLGSLCILGAKKKESSERKKKPLNYPKKADSKREGENAGQKKSKRGNAYTWKRGGL